MARQILPPGVPPEVNEAYTENEREVTASGIAASARATIERNLTSSRKICRVFKAILSVPGKNCRVIKRNFAR